MFEERRYLATSIITPGPDGATPLNDRISVAQRDGHCTYFCGVEPVYRLRKTRGATVMTDDVIAEAQDLLNRAQSRRQIIEKLGMKYDTVRKAINQGRLRELSQPPSQPRVAQPTAQSPIAQSHPAPWLILPTDKSQGGVADVTA